MCYNEYTTEEGKPHKPERVTTMTKNTMNTILSLIANIDTAEANEVREVLTAELNKGAERKAQTAELYETVKPIVMAALSETPVTLSELFDEIESELPEGFTKSKLQYAITRLWKDEVTKVEGKVNGYALKG